MHACRPAGRSGRSCGAAQPRSWVEITTVRPCSRRRPERLQKERLRWPRRRRSCGSSSSTSVGVLHQRPGQQHPLALAAGELADLAAGSKPCMPTESSASRGPPPLGRARAAAASRCAGSRPAGRRRAPPAGSPRRPAPAAACSRSAPGASMRAAAAAAACPAMRAQQRRLAGAVGPDQPDDHPAGTSSETSSSTRRTRRSTVSPVDAQHRGASRYRGIGRRSPRTARAARPGPRRSARSRRAETARATGSSAQPSSVRGGAAVDAHDVVVVADVGAEARRWPRPPRVPASSAKPSSRQRSTAR